MGILNKSGPTKKKTPYVLTQYVTAQGAIYVCNSEVYLQSVRRDYQLSNHFDVTPTVAANQTDGTIVYHMRVKSRGTI